MDIAKAKRLAQISLDSGGMTMSARTLFKAALLASTLAVSGAASAATLYSQPANFDGQAFASQNDPSFGNFATVYDNFTLGSAAAVTGLSFTGQFFNPASIGGISNFTIKFYANNAGQPGGALATASIPGNGGQSCAGVICTYSVAVSFAAAAGTQYWLSIVPDLTFPPQWGWQQGIGGDNSAYQDFFGDRSQLNSDLAFTLTGGAAVPEPAQWALLIGGFALAGAALRRRRAGLAVA